MALHSRLHRKLQRNLAVIEHKCLLVNATLNVGSDDAMTDCIGVGLLCTILNPTRQISAFAVLINLWLARSASEADELHVVMQETVDQRRIQREISILRRLSHGCIIQLLEIVETEHFIYLVCNGHG